MLLRILKGTFEEAVSSGYGDGYGYGSFGDGYGRFGYGYGRFGYGYGEGDGYGRFGYGYGEGDGYGTLTNNGFVCLES